jgi:hypothetical protein
MAIFLVKMLKVLEKPNSKEVRSSAALSNALVRSSAPSVRSSTHCRTGKSRVVLRTSIRSFFMTKAPLSLVFAAGHTAYVFLLFICKRGNPKEG